MVKKHVINIAKRDYLNYYGINLTSLQANDILSQDPDLLVDLEGYRESATGFDTFDREALPYLLCRYLKIDRVWPTNGDTEEYKTSFFKELELCCASADIKLKGRE